MTPEALLADFETRTHKERVQAMIALGRRSSTDPEAAATIRTLATGGFYERSLALHSCAGSRDGAAVLQAMHGESRLLRKLAAWLAPVVCGDEQIVAALKIAAPRLQRTLFFHLIRHKRQAAIDAFLTDLAATDTERLGPLLPFGSTEVVQRHWASVRPRFGTNDWYRLTHRHPRLAFETLLAEVQTQTEPNARLLYEVNLVLGALPHTHPDDALTLLTATMRHAPLGKLSLRGLAECRPNELADRILASEDEVTVSLSGVAHQLTPDRLLALLQQRPALLAQNALWWPRIRPELRRSVYELTGLRWQTTEGVLNWDIVALLPRDLREREGRRNFALPALATRTAQRLSYATFLPWDEARALLDPFMRNPDADQRGIALAALLGAVRYQPERLTEALQVIRARANEQDPVRRRMLATLAALPPSRWQTEHLAGLSHILQDTLNAADLSPTTASEAEKLIVGLVPLHPEWAAPWLATLAQTRGNIHSPLVARLNNADIRRIAPALTPVFRFWEDRARTTSLIQAADRLGRRLRVFPELEAILERVLGKTRQSNTASTILHILRQHRPDRLATVVPALLQSDPSTITLHYVLTYLHQQRQDLITPYLGQQAYSGRFSTGQTRFVLPFRDGFFRWTPTQQAIFAETLTEVTQDPVRDAPALTYILHQLGALPAVYPSRLIQLASEPEPEKPAVRDVALQVLARLDAGQGVPTLVEALADSRARIAIYALRTELREMPAEQALALLRQVPMQRVTVAKEVIRLIGELNTPDAYPFLLSLAQQDLHRDVRIALLRGLWDHLERDETWPILMRAAVDPEPAVARGVVNIPTSRLSPVAQNRLLDLIGTLLDHPNVEVRQAVLGRCAYLPLPDPDRTLLPRLLVRLASPLPDECSVAARAVFATYAGEDPNAVSTAIARIIGDRSALVTTLNALQAAVVQNRTRLLPTVRGVLEVLRTDPLTARNRVDLAVAGLSWEEIVTFLTALAVSGDLYAEVLMAAVQAIERYALRRSDSRRLLLTAREPADPTGDMTGLVFVEDALSGSADERLRRLAFAALVARSTTAEGWTPPLRARLEAYRRDPSPLVAAAAQFTFPPPAE